MDPILAKTYLPPYWRGVRKNHVGVQKKIILCAFDTETFYGKVFALGFTGPDGRVTISHGLKTNHIRFLLDNIRLLPGKGNGSIICGAHYLVFDLSVLFWDIINPLGSTRAKAPKRSHFSLLNGREEIEIFWGKPCFAKIIQDGKTIQLIDTFAFFMMGLAAALKMIGGTVQKEKKPEDIGKRLIPLAELRPYLNMDTLGVLELLREIQRLHEKYETRFCVSLPQLSSRIFRHFYVCRDFVVPSAPLMAGALLSYHGGKNSFPGRAGWYKDCYDLDINSAYPEAMSQLPDFENGKWVYGTGMAFFRKHLHGIYKISGSIRPCPWGSLFAHDFKKLSGAVRDLWVTGYEIKSAEELGEINITRISGYGFRSPTARGIKSDTAFARFTADFFKLKNEAKTKTESYWYKLILNSCYGKFIQRTDEEDDEGQTLRVAGSMFDPAIASLITGFVRARVHHLEHKYKAIHTATDGIITQRLPDPIDMGAGIGKLKCGNFGPCLIIRNKLYLHFDRGGRLAKSGLHGFEGSADELEKLWKSSKRIYHISRLVKWGEAWHMGIPPGTQLNRPKELKIK